MKRTPRNIHELSKAIAYPMLIDDDEMVAHPTHGGYSQARKNLPPQNLKPLVSLPITIPLVGGSQQINLLKTDAPPQHHAPNLHQQRTTLESLFSLNCTDAPQMENIPLSCPRCHSENVRTNGTRNGKQRYRCNDCGKSF